ncbi:MAG: (Fe-S)-binding protein [Rhodospirillales bacterium]|jgi:L-lactate dehydrogenase complex protein LldE
MPSSSPKASFSSGPKVGLFVTCLVDLMRPSVGFASVKLLEDAGCQIFVPESQTCCGQPAYNAGDTKDAKDIARLIVDAFEEFEYVVAPSGSCAGMIKEHYPKLFADDLEMTPRVFNLAKKTYELTSFLIDVMNIQDLDVSLDQKVTYHDSCAGLRELGVKDQPRQLLAQVEGLIIEEYEEAETCCGFGGTFCVKYSDISDHMVGKSIDALSETDAEVVLGGDLGCLMNIQGKLSRLKDEGKESNLKVRHVAEVLAGMTDTAPIGEANG